MAERFGTTLGKEAVQTIIQRALPRVSARTRAKQTRAGIAEGVKQVKGAAAAVKRFVTPERAFKAGQAVGTVLRLAGPLAVGLATYKLVRSRVVKGMETKQAAKQRAIEAAVVQARIAAEAQVGRKLRPSELANLNQQVEVELGGLP